MGCVCVCEHMLDCGVSRYVSNVTRIIHSHVLERHPHVVYEPSIELYKRALHFDVRADVVDATHFEEFGTSSPSNELLHHLGVPLASTFQYPAYFDGIASQFINSVRQMHLSECIIRCAVAVSSIERHRDN